MVNHHIMQGRLVADPEFRTTTGGTAVSNFRIAWSEKYKDKETKCFLECKAFGPTAEFMQKYMNAKGQEILVEGKMTTEEWEKDGQKRSKNVLLVSNAHFCGRKQETEGSQSNGGFTAVETDSLPF